MPAKSMRLALAAVALLTGSVSIPAQSSPNEIYRAAVGTYVRTGDAAKSVERLVGWDKSTLESTVKDVIAQTRSTGTEGAAFLEAAALLHLEIGIAMAGISTASSQGYLDLGEQLIDSLVPLNDAIREAMSDRRKAEIVRIRSTWLGVAGSAFLSVNDTPRARRLFDKADRISPKNAAILTLQGTAEEIDGVLFNPEDLDSVRVRERMARERARLLFAADRRYREALRADPNYPLAQIRVGRVMHLTRNFKQAEEWLEKGNAVAIEPSHRYLGAMFLGALLQEQGDLDGARQAFETALTIAPRSQNATVALGYVELISGRANQAQALARGYLMTPNSDDVWWASKNGTLDLVGFQWLRERVRR